MLLVLMGTWTATAQTVWQSDTVRSQPADIAMNPVTNLAYVANQGSNTVSVVNGAGNSATVTISTPAGSIASLKNDSPSSGYNGFSGVRFAALGFCCLAALLSAAKKRRKAFAGTALLLLCLIVSSCGGHFTAPAITPPPSGTYRVTITEVVTPAPSPPLTHFVQTSLIVQLVVGK